MTYPSHFRSVVHDAVEDACAAHGFKPVAAHEVAETATLVSFVAAGLGVSLVPASVSNMTVEGAIYRPLAQDTTLVELAVAWRRDDDRPVLAARARRHPPRPRPARPVIRSPHAKTLGVLAVLGLVVAFSLSSTLVKRAESPACSWPSGAWSPSAWSGTWCCGAPAGG